MAVRALEEKVVVVTKVEKWLRKGAVHDPGFFVPPTIPFLGLIATLRIFAQQRCGNCLASVKYWQKLNRLCWKRA